MKSNCKIVNDKIKQHIMEYVEDYEYGIETLIENLNAVKFGDVTDNYKAMVKLVEGGEFLISYCDQRDFLNSLGINPDNKEYSDDKVWDLYKHLIAREGVKLLK
jgi:predicted RecB family endonuclease